MLQKYTIYLVFPSFMTLLIPSLLPKEPASLFFLPPPSYSLQGSTEALSPETHQSPLLGLGVVLWVSLSPCVLPPWDSVHGRDSNFLFKVINSFHLRTACLGDFCIISMFRFPGLRIIPPWENVSISRFIRPIEWRIKPQDILWGNWRLLKAKLKTLKASRDKEWVTCKASRMRLKLMFKAKLPTTGK